MDMDKIATLLEMMGPVFCGWKSRRNQLRNKVLGDFGAKFMESKVKAAETNQKNYTGKNWVMMNRK